MDLEKLTSVHQALKTLEEDGGSYSESIHARVDGLTIDEKIQLAREAAASTRTLAGEVISHCVDGKVDLGDAGSYTVVMDDRTVSVYREQYQYGPNGNYNGFESVVSLDTEQTYASHVYPALDAQETLQVLHDAVVPKDS